MKSSLLVFLKKHAVALIASGGVGAYAMVAGTTGSCPSCALLVSLAGLSWPASTARAADQPSLAQVSSQIAPAWKLRDLEGKPVKSNDFAGKVVVLDFWATWCQPCRAEIPGLIELQKQYGEKGLVIIGVSLDQEGPAVGVPFAKQFGINYPLVMGDKKIVEAFGGINGIPTTFIIDRKGHVASRHVGNVPKGVFEADLKPLL